jgi:hypothetical protein
MVHMRAAAVVAVIASANAFLQPAPMAVKSGEKLSCDHFTPEHGHVLMRVAFLLACCSNVDADDPQALCSCGPG